MSFLVALAAGIGFLIGIGSAVLDPATIGGLLIGGVLVAPPAAWLATKIPAPVLGSAVGGIIAITNTRTILRALDITGWASATICLFITGAWIAGLRNAPVEVVGEPSTDQPSAVGHRG